MSIDKDKGPGISVRLSWGEVLAFVAFIILVGPSLIYIGSIANRLTNVEKAMVRHEELDAHAVQQQRSARDDERWNQILREVSNLNQRLARVEARLEIQREKK